MSGVIQQYEGHGLPEALMARRLIRSGKGGAGAAVPTGRRRDND